MEQKKRSSFSSRIGFVLAAAGSAVGLGNLWRFPYLAARYGGGIFLLVYLILALTFGFSLMITEIAIGRKTRLSCIGAYKALDKRFGFLGWLAAFVPFIITPYYCIIGGWVTKYTAAYLGNGPEALADGGDFFTGFITSNAESYIWMLVFMAIVFVIVGLVLPTILECWMLWLAKHEFETSRTGQMISALSDAGVLVGGFMLRLLIVSAAVPITIIQPWML